jgi:hypothetical protein
MTASGSLNINDLTYITTTTLGGSGIGVNTATFIMGSNGDFDTYSGFTSTPSDFGTGGGGASTSSSGDIFGVIFQGTPPYELAVPKSYVTGSAISSTQTFSGETFGSLGLIPGTYTYTWGSGANADLINVVVGNAGVTPTPTPSVTPTSSVTPTPTITPTSSLNPTPTNTVTPTPTTTPGTSGNFNVTVSQVGPDVVWSGSGTFNTTALIPNGSQSLSAGFSAPNAAWAIGDPTLSGQTLNVYSGVTTFVSSFGTSGGALGTLSGLGDTFGILPNGTNRNLLVPTGYVSGSFISGSTTYAGTTIAGMNLIPGVYTWSWGSGGNASSLVMTIN